MSANWSYKSTHSINVVPELIQLEQSWYSQGTGHSLDSLNQVIDAVRDHCEINSDKQTSLYQVIDYLLDELAFTGPGLQELPESDLSSVNYCIQNRTGSHLTMSLVFCHILQELGFESVISDVNEEIVLVVKLSNSEVIIVDSLTGATEYLIANDDVKNSIVSDVAAVVNPIDHEELIKITLTEQKMCLLEENQFELALLCVEALMELLPEDPYERRDRGLVLKELNCEKWAKDDFDYFIKACPNDPMAMFIRLQLEDQSPIVETIH